MARNSNAGVEGGSGYTFQRCCVVYLLFSDYKNIQFKNYFICVEHHDDFLFAFLDEHDVLQKVDTYQAKKSRDDWKTDKVLCELIEKITLVGKELINDEHPKSEHYNHTLSFLTNKNILLHGKLPPKKSQKNQEKVKVQVSNNLVNYKELHDDIKSNIKSKLSDNELATLEQLDNLRFRFIDLPQSHKNWQRVLTGLSLETLGNTINDHEAAITTFMKLLQDIELTYNNDDLVLLSDKNKRITKNKIDETFNMLVNSRKSFDFWRNHAENLSKELELSLPIQRRSKELLDNCFDYFKDIAQIEYRKIYNFVDKSRAIDNKHYNEADCIIELYNNYFSECNPRLEKHMVAFAVIAAYVETRGMHV